MNQIALNICVKQKEKTYVNEVIESEIFDNDFDTLVPQIKVAQLVKEHFASENSGKKKALLIGFDGGRADGLIGVLTAKQKGIYSGISLLKEEGGLYLGYTGGSKDSTQNTSTTQGWAATLTGFWSVDSGVIDMETLTKKETVLMELAKKGRTAYFIARWDEHFTHTYSKEIATAMNSSLPLSFCGRGSKTDAELHQIAIKAIQDDKTDVVFNIYEDPDYTGHSSTFGNHNHKYIKVLNLCDKYAYELIENVKNRKTYDKEDWLIIISSDHGGHVWRHGTQMIQDRTIFIATNKKINFNK